MRNKNFLVIINVIIALLLIGCASNNAKSYEQFTNDYYKLYLQVTDSVNIKDTISTLKSIQSEDSKKNIEKLHELLEKEKDKVPESQKEHYNGLQKSYEGLKFLSTANQNLDVLTLEEKAKIWTEISIVNITRENIQSEQK